MIKHLHCAATCFCGDVINNKNSDKVEALVDSRTNTRHLCVPAQLIINMDP